MKAKAPIPKEMERRIKELIDREVKKSVKTADDKYRSDLDAIILWAVHITFGAGRTRLKRFWDTFLDEHDQLMRKYELDGTVEDYAWICREKLRSVGVTLDSWQHESERKENSDDSGS